MHGSVRLAQLFGGVMARRGRGSWLVKGQRDGFCGMGVVVLLEVCNAAPECVAFARPGKEGEAIVFLVVGDFHSWVVGDR